MGITAKEIQEQGFEHSRKGYDVDEVDVFLEHVAVEVDNLNREIADLRARLEEAQSASDATMVAPAPQIVTREDPKTAVALAEAQARISELEAQVAEQSADARAISEAIISAQKSAERIRQEARDQGQKIYDESEAKSREIIRDALTTKQKTVNELEQLKKARDEFQDQYYALLRRFEDQGNKIFESSEKFDLSDLPSSVIPEEYLRETASSASAYQVDAEPEPASAVQGSPIVGDVSAYGDTEDGFDILDDLD